MARRRADDPTADGPAIQTVQRAALILGAFTPARPRLSLAEITEAMAVSKATAHRYARALRAASLLRYDPAESRYSLGPQLLALEAAARAALPIVTAAEPHMQRLLAEADHTVVLSVWNGESPVVVRCVDNTSGDVRLSVRTGVQLDLLRSAQGRVFTTFLPGAELPASVRRLRPSAQARQVAEEIRRAGVAENSPEDFGVRVFAAPVFERGQVVAAMAVLGTTVSLEGGALSAPVEALRRAAAALSRELGDLSD
ncbi:IclR family transcriptional regulator [Micromonospora sp. NPDC049900]|uniref:IclR family transcriptional regulator n=1 Tax=unclassified Micromonospora TaxID=2617518 RepID=UPI00379BE387